ncbi:50S ribosomal protein L10 [Candidatus Micrarchaeota archaeon CG10_big_fil_rev_8_21_14_0_10_45_29]|nr:MAG: 50S ribosomal protein L10 [Candidatus Micrarchaeota archaeon CG10_big_fil_rev_8_21_14_0_10_45_29]
MTKIKGFKKNQKPKERPAKEKKKMLVQELSAEIKSAKTVVLLDVRNLPDRLLQAARKQLRGKNTKFLMSKNSVLKRALEASGADGKRIAELMKTPSVVVISQDLSPYDIFRHFKLNKQKVAAKPGQMAESDIIVPAGETDLPPGPALSELKLAGINARIAGGKIAVAKDSTVAKKGEKISGNVCKALQKLNILPFMAGISMVAGVRESTLYMAEVLDIDEKQLFDDLVSSCAQCYNCSVNCIYPTEMNISHLLSGSIMQAVGLVRESGAYSESHIQLVLAPAMRMQDALEARVGNLAGSSASAEASEGSSEAQADAGKPEEKSPDGEGERK